MVVVARPMVFNNMLALIIVYDLLNNLHFSVQIV